MKPKKLVFVKWNQNLTLKEQLRRTCRLHQTEYTVIDKKTPYPVMVYEICSADYTVIWHGSSPLVCWAKDVCESLGKQYIIAECGWFPQSAYWHFDPDGICGKSSLCGDLPEPSEEDWEELKRRRMDYQTSIDPIYMRELNLPEGYILCPFQVSHDSTIYYDAPYKTNQEFAAHVMEKFPDDPIVFKVHPKQTRDIVRTERNDVYVVRQGSFIDYTPNAKMVYGQTSTTLVESALLQVPTEAIGKCPLFYHQHSPEEIEKLLAVMCSRQVSRDLNKDLWKYITKERNQWL